MTQVGNSILLSQASDDALLRMFVERKQEEAFAEIVRRHGGVVLSVCRSVLGSMSDSEDAAQAVFLTLAQKAKSGSVRRSLVGWLHQVAWYVAQRAAQARSIRRRHELEAGRMKEQVIPDGPHEPAMLQALHAGLAQLPEKYRIALLLHHFESRSQEETAALLGCSVSAAAMRLNRGRQMLRGKLSRRGTAAGTVATAPAFAAVLAAQGAAGASPAFVATAANAATAVLAGHLTKTTLISAQTLALWKGATHMLFWTKVKAIAVVMAVVLAVGGAGTVLVSHALAATDQPTLTGTLTAVSGTSVGIQTGSGTFTITINGATTVKVNGQTATAADLKAGMKAAIFGQHLSQGNPATEIRAYTPQTSTTHPTPPPTTATPALTGTLTAVSNTSVSIQTGSGAFTIAINSATVVKVSGQPATAGELKVGMRAAVLGQHLSQGQPATEIRAYMPQTSTTHPAPPPPAVASPALTGTLTAVGNTSVSIQTGSGTFTITIDNATAVKVNGQVATAGDLKIGMKAAIFGQHLSQGQPATEIRAYAPKAP